MKEKNINKIESVYHDIKAPIETIKGLSKLLEEKEQSESLKKYSDAIFKTCMVLDNLLDDLKIANSKNENFTKLEEKMFSLPSLIENVCAVIDFQAKNKKQKFRYTINLKSEELFIGDTRLLSKLLLNLLNNSIKYTPENGSIKFSTYVNELNKNISELVFIVEDNGIGIDKNFINNIFKPYQRENNITVNNQQGKGLGLALCKKIVDAYNGTIKVNSHKEKGSVFTITFCLKNYNKIDESKVYNLAFFCNSFQQNYIENAYINSKTNLFFDDDIISFTDNIKYNNYDAVIIDISELRVHRKKVLETIKRLRVKTLILLKNNDDETKYEYSSIDGIIKKPFLKSSVENIINDNNNEKYFINKSILIVEDNYLNQEFIKNTLNGHFPLIHSAFDGLDCIKKVKKRNYDIILLDINMPHLNGINAYKKMIFNKLIDIDNTLVIILSANKNYKHHLNLGLNYSLTKSFRIEELQKIIDRFEKSKH